MGDVRSSGHLLSKSYEQPTLCQLTLWIKMVVNLAKKKGRKKKQINGNINKIFSLWMIFCWYKKKEQRLLLWIIGTHTFVLVIRVWQVMRLQFWRETTKAVKQEETLTKWLLSYKINLIYKFNFNSLSYITTLFFVSTQVIPCIYQRFHLVISIHCSLIGSLLPLDSRFWRALPSVQLVAVPNSFQMLWSELGLAKFPTLHEALPLQKKFHLTIKQTFIG